MKALQLERPEHWRQIDIAEPVPPGPGDALVRVHNVGICGTDISGYLGKMPFFSYPRIPGHELGVEVVALGEGVTNVRVGDRCAIEAYLNCQQCYACQRGHTNCCENNQTLGVHCDGGLRPFFTIPARKLHASKKLSFEQLALVETLAIGCHAINRGAAKPSENVLVIGAGPIGLSVIEFAKLSGARTIVMDMNQQRLDFCRNVMGVQTTILAKGDGAEMEALRKATNGQMPDLVVDATGSNKSMGHALNYCAFAGRLVYVGITQQEISFLHAPVLHRRELTIMASRNAVASEFKRIISAIEDGQLNTDPWITHRTTFDELIARFPSYTKPETGVIKAMVTVE
ncbi:MAG TPA: zinc-binding alcohol dehydrogenase family protein [Methylomirabilota bacterium]|nr:zinc-binding alcohol dehydrogenase family protein [Methylomirabilota bacterium]